MNVKYSVISVFLELCMSILLLHYQHSDTVATCDYTSMEIFQFQPWCATWNIILILYKILNNILRKKAFQEKRCVLISTNKNLLSKMKDRIWRKWGVLNSDGRIDQEVINGV